MEYKKISLVVISILILFASSIACNQSGEIISPALATQRFEATQVAAAGDASSDAEGAKFLGGAKAELIGEAYLVALYQKAGETVSVSFATRGDVITVVGSVVFEDIVWYKIESLAGSYWLPETNLLAIE